MKTKRMPLPGSGKRAANSEKGVVLIFTMIFMGLLVSMTLVSVQFSSLEQKMAASFHTNQQAFIVAETALLEAERCIKEETRCNKISTFTSDCNDGLCFSGADRNSILSCHSGNSQPWNNASLWADTSKTIAATTLPTGTSARYLIEFLCYAPKELSGVIAVASKPVNWFRVYRITVLASIDDPDSQVMIQSTYKN